MGTFRGGLNVLKDGMIRKFVHDKNNKNSLSNNWIWDIAEDRAGNFWIGTNDGIDKYDPKTQKFSSFKPLDQFSYLYSVNNIRSLYLDDEAHLWVGSFGGFGRFDIHKNTFDYFVQSGKKAGDLNNDIIVKIFEDSKHRLWLGTYGGGLNLFDKERKTFKAYTEDDGLPSNLIQSIEEDRHGNLWISTIKGIVKFDPEEEVFHVLDKGFGLQGDVFKHNASLTLSSGKMLFGGINGFNAFFPDSIYFSDRPPKVIFTDFLIFNKLVKPGITNSILSQSIEFTKQIALSYQDSRFISFVFTAPDFTGASGIRYSYQLEGFDKQWNDIGNQSKVSFTNLSPGSYILKIRASKNNLWPDQFTSLNITIVPPFYMRKWVVAMAVMMGVFIILAIFRYRSFYYRRRQKLLEQLVDEQNREISEQNKELRTQNNRLQDTQEKLKTVNATLEQKVKRRTKKLNQTVEQLNKSIQELDRFVYSASHDLSAPLKSIKGLVNIARIDNKDNNLVTHLDYIERSIAKLEEVISDLIQFSRNSRSELKFEGISLLDTILEINKSLKFLPGYDNIHFKMDIDEGVHVVSDKQRLKMILHNLLSNAVKYHDPEKEYCHVTIAYEEFPDAWRLTISDNGIGISSSHLDKVFQMFYRATELSSGTGLGLYIVKEAIDKLGGSISAKGKEKEGCSFAVKLPKK